MNPINGPKQGFYNGQGEHEESVPCRTNPRKILLNKVRFLVYVYEGSVLNARWEIFGDPIACAVCSWIVENISSKPVSELPHIVYPERIALELGINNEHDIRAGCMTAIKALAAAMEDYRNREDSNP